MFARRAKGWRLVLLVAFAAGLFVVEEAAPLSAQLHTILQLAIFLSTLALMALWVRQDTADAYAEEAARLMVIDILDIPASNVQRPISNLQSPTSGFRGTISLERTSYDSPEITHVVGPDRPELD